MAKLRRKADGTYEVDFFSSIDSAIQEAQDIATRESKVVRFEFNSAMINVSATSDPVLIKRDFRRAMAGYPISGRAC
jgi:hypothetical protein